MTLLRDLRPVASLLLTGRRSTLLGGALAASATVIAGMALLGLSGWFITATAIAGLSTATALAFDVFAPAAAIRFLAMARTGSRYGERLLTHDATLGVLVTLRERLFRGYAQRDMARVLRSSPARLLFRLTEDIDALGALYLRVLVPACAAMASILVASVALGLLNPLLGVVAFVVLVITGVGSAILVAWAGLGPAWRRAHALEMMRSRTVDIVAGQTDFAMTGLLPAQLRLFARDDRRLERADYALNRVDTLASAGLGIASAGILAATLLAAGLLADAGRIDAPLAALAVLIALVAIEPFSGLRRGMLDLGRTLLAARRLSPRLAAASPVATRIAPPPGHALRVASAVVRHEGAGRAVFDGLSLDIHTGEIVALIGPSGAGKSTLLALIAGEIDAQSGTVAALDSTLFTQRTELFQDSLRDNLRLACPEAADASLWAVLRDAGLADDVRRLPSGLDARLGEGGLGLSGGQLRRLALARLLLRDSPVWLLDEQSEGLDGGTARDVLSRVFDLARGRTVVMATHSRREASYADRLVVMDRGRIVACPTKGDDRFTAALAGLRPD